MVVPFETTALNVDSPNGRACVVAESESDKISFELTTASKINSSNAENRLVYFAISFVCVS